MRTSVMVLSGLLAVAGCKGEKKGGKDEGGKPAEAGDKPAAGGDKPAEGGAAPAPGTPLALAPLGITIDAPAGASVEDTSVDAPSVTVSTSSASIMVSTVTDAYPSTFDAAKASIQ